MIIVVGNQKGGCGKTTTATNIATVLARQGKDVVVFDADRQESASEWVDDRNKYHKDMPTVYSAMGYNDISDSVADLSRRYDVVIVEAAGRDSNECRSCLVVADILITPVKPSQIDISSLSKMNELITQYRFVNDRLKTLGFINIAPTHAKNQEIEQSKEAVNQCSNITLLNTIVHDRKCFRDAFSEGLGVVELTGKSESEAASRLEIEKLVTEIINGN